MKWTPAKTLTLIGLGLLLLVGVTVVVFHSEPKPVRIEGIPSDWSVLKGTPDQWNWTNNEFSGHTTNGDSILASTEQYRNVSLSALVGTTNREATLLLRFQDAENGYLAAFVPDGTPAAKNDTSKVSLLRRRGGQEKELALFIRRGLSAPGKMEKLTFSASGSRLEVRLNDTLILATNDTTFASGYIGLRVFGDPKYPCDGVFSNLTVRARGLKLTSEAKVRGRENVAAESLKVDRDQPSVAMPPTARPVELKLKWPPAGERLVLDTDVKQSGEYLSPGQPEPVKQDSTKGRKFGLTVLRTIPGGGHEVELEFLSLRDRSFLGGRKVVDYDSSEQLSALGTNSLVDLWGKVVGSKIRYFLDASNEIERVEGIDELEQRLSSGAATNTSAFSRVLYGRDYLKEMINGLHLFLPPKPVRPGDTWPVQMDLAMGPLGTVNMDFTVTLKGWEPHWNRNCARLEFQSTVKTKPDSTGTAASSLEGTIAGVAWFDPALGMIIETVANNDMKMVINQTSNPGGNPRASGLAPGTAYQWHDAVNTTLVLETPEAPIAGIGVALRVDGENIVIQQIIPGLPAAAQKDIHAGDRIIAVAQDTGPAVPVHAGQLAQAVALIHGPAGSTVRLTLVSSGEDDSRARVVSIVRAELKVPPRCWAAVPT